jgi:hypothetical protein
VFEFSVELGQCGDVLTEPAGADAAQPGLVGGEAWLAASAFAAFAVVPVVAAGAAEW